MVPSASQPPRAGHGDKSSVNEKEYNLDDAPLIYDMPFLQDLAWNDEEPAYDRNLRSTTHSAEIKIRRSVSSLSPTMAALASKTQRHSVGRIRSATKFGWRRSVDATPIQQKFEV